MKKGIHAYIYIYIYIYLENHSPLHNSSSNTQTHAYTYLQKLHIHGFFAAKHIQTDPNSVNKSTAGRGGFQILRWVSFLPIKI